MELEELLALNASQTRRRRRIGRLPKAIFPREIERDYVKFARAVVAVVRGAYRKPLESIAAVFPRKDWARRRRDTDTQFVTELSPVDLLLGSQRADATSDQVKRFLEQAKEEMRKAVRTVPLEGFLKQHAERTREWSEREFSKQSRAAVGVDLFTPNPAFRERAAGFVAANVERITNLTEDAAQRMNTLILQAVQDGRSFDGLAAEIETSFNVSESRAITIARDQTGKFYGQVNADQQKAAGITKFVWRTSNDSRVRDSHASLEGEVFSYDAPPSVGLPGEDINCRCHAEPYFEDLLN